MKVINPTKSDIQVVIKGTPYFLKAEGSLSNVPEEHARYWQEMLHKFLRLKKDDVAKTDTTTAEATLAPMAMTEPEEEEVEEVETEKEEITEDESEEVEESDETTEEESADESTDEVTE